MPKIRFNQRWTFFYTLVVFQINMVLSRRPLKNTHERFGRKQGLTEALWDLSSSPNLFKLLNLTSCLLIPKFQSFVCLHAWVQMTCVGNGNMWCSRVGNRLPENVGITDWWSNVGNNIEMVISPFDVAFSSVWLHFGHCFWALFSDGNRPSMYRQNSLLELFTSLTEFVSLIEFTSLIDLWNLMEYMHS